MKQFIKNRLIQTTWICSLFFSSFAFTSCNKYEEGPFLSLSPAENRVAGVWVITKATKYENDDSEDVTNDYDDDSFTFSEDKTVSHSFSDGTTNVTANGEWELLNDDETLSLSESWSILGNTFTNTTDWAIHRLTNKEMILEKTSNDVRTRVEMKGE